VEGLASVIVVWRFTGARTVSETAERRAQRAVALSFWLRAPYIAAAAVRDLLASHQPETSPIGMALTAVALLEMPRLGRTKHKLALKIDSKATAGEGTQNYLCAAQAAAVLLNPLRHRDLARRLVARPEQPRPHRPRLPLRPLKWRLASLVSAPGWLGKLHAGA
jgi:hypothetical protein